jgi:hypothetical protein
MVPVVKLHVSMKQAAGHSDHMAAWYGALLCFNPKHYATNAHQGSTSSPPQSSKVYTVELK